MFRHLLYPFLVYRSLFYPFFVLSSVIIPCWLGYRIYRLRTQRQPLSWRREILLLVFVLYLCGVASATLAPNHPSRSSNVGIELRPNLEALTCSAARMPSGSNARFFCLYNAKGNVLLFVPFGILLPLVWRRLRFGRGVQAALAGSVGIEALQYLSRTWGSYRLADVNDVVLNVLGASLGLASVFLVRSFRREGAQKEKRLIGVRP